ncbi:hypothetical protein JHK87_036356 [Glycine soja]|nr:hypothetical protein JHK87_036356 [Glycine soja]
MCKSGRSVKRVKRQRGNKLIDNPLDLAVLAVPLLSCGYQLSHFKIIKNL